MSKRMFLCHRSIAGVRWPSGRSVDWWRRRELDFRAASNMLRRRTVQPCAQPTGTQVAGLEEVFCQDTQKYQKHIRSAIWGL